MKDLVGHPSEARRSLNRSVHLFVFDLYYNYCMYDTNININDNNNEYPIELRIITKTIPIRLSNMKYVFDLVRTH